MLFYHSSDTTPNQSLVLSCVKTQPFLYHSLSLLLYQTYNYSRCEASTLLYALMLEESRETLRRCLWLIITNKLYHKVILSIFYILFKELNNPSLIKKHSQDLIQFYPLTFHFLYSSYSGLIKLLLFENYFDKYLIHFD